jgi:hypothetical protein
LAPKRHARWRASSKVSFCSLASLNAISRAQALQLLEHGLCGVGVQSLQVRDLEPCRVTHVEHA